MKLVFIEKLADTMHDVVWGTSDLVRAWGLVDEPAQEGCDFELLHSEPTSQDVHVGHKAGLYEEEVKQLVYLDPDKDDIPDQVVIALAKRALLSVTTE